MRGVVADKAFAAVVVCWIVLLACWLAGTELAGAQTGGIEPTPSDIRQGIRLTREDVQRARANRCRAPRLWNWKYVRNIPRDRLEPNLAYVQDTLRWTRRGWDMCPVNLWWWYRSSGAECIGRHEGGWRSNTGNGYFGRFQANHDFARGYGRKYYVRLGTPNNWPRVSQIHMAYNGYRARSWYPWPTTARLCGLI